MGRNSERKLKERELLENTYTFKGETYSSYYQLEKVMGIPRKTIQYRHEIIGLSIDDIPDFKPKPLIERFGEKKYFPKPKGEDIENELKKIIEYPKSPEFHIDSNNEDRTKERKEKYAKWLINAPKTLIHRELRIYEGDLKVLLEEEKNQYFYASTHHEEEKEKAEIAIQIIHDILDERELDIN